MLQQALPLADKDPRLRLLSLPPSLLMLHLPPSSHPPAVRAQARPLLPRATASPHPPPRAPPQAPPYPQLPTRFHPTRALQVRPNDPQHLPLDAQFPMLRNQKTRFW